MDRTVPAEKSEVAHWLSRLELDRQFFPLHRAVSNAFRSVILAGDLAPMSPLPTEPLLARQLGISRFTLRQALDTLAREGLIRREHGRGNFVTGPDYAGAVTRFIGFTFEQSEDEHVIVLRTGLTLPPQDIAEEFGLDPGASVFEILRLRSLARTPIALEYLYLPRSTAATLNHAELTQPRMTRFLTDQSGLAPTQCTQRITARPVDPQIARYIGVAAGSIGLVRLCVLMQDHQAIAVRRSFHPPEKVTYVASGPASEFAL